MAERQPIDVSVAQAAQIPLQSFTIPDFPPEASSLKALTLTSDIKLDEYSKILEHPATVSRLPKSIESLTLELFSLGYPPGFLNDLSIQLPALKELLVYSQLFAGISKASRKDAEKFFQNEKQLRALHLLDVFAKPGFFETVGKTLSTRGKDGIRFLEVNYSFRHEDEAFLETIPAGELVYLIGPSLVTCAFNISPPDVTNDPDDPANLDKKGGEQQRRHEGVLAINHSMSPYLVDALVKEETAPKELLLLNTTLYTLTLEGLSEILSKHTGLLVLHVTVDLEPTEQHKKAILAALSQCPKLEQVEVVGNPSLQFYIAVSNPPLSSRSSPRPLTHC